MRVGDRPVRALAVADPQMLGFSQHSVDRAAFEIRLFHREGRITVVVIGHVKQAPPRSDQPEPAVGVDRQFVLAAKVPAETRQEPEIGEVGRTLGERVPRGEAIRRGARRAGATSDDRSDPLVERPGDERLLAVARETDDADLILGDRIAVLRVQQVVQRPTGQPGLGRDLRPRRLGILGPKSLPNVFVVRVVLLAVMAVHAGIEADEVAACQRHLGPTDLVVSRRGHQDRKRALAWRSPHPDLHRRLVWGIEGKPHPTTCRTVFVAVLLKYVGLDQRRHALGKRPDEIAAHQPPDLLFASGPVGGVANRRAVEEFKQRGQIRATTGLRRGRGSRRRMPSRAGKRNNRHKEEHREEAFLAHGSFDSRVAGATATGPL